MVAKLFILNLFIFSLQASVGVISALQAPLFEHASEDSKVLEYAKKGSELFIHPQEFMIKEIEVDKDLSLSELKVALKNEILEKPSKHYNPDLLSLFYKTLTKDARVAYVLKRHVFLEYKDKREFQYNFSITDDSDYRIPEPLSPHYPLYGKKAYQTKYLFALGRPNYKGHPYKEDILGADQDLIKELSFIWSKDSQLKDLRRFNFGVSLGFHNSSQKYQLQTFNSLEEALRIYVGPYAGYRIYQSSNSYVEVSNSVQYSLFDLIKISAQDIETKTIERRAYLSYLSFSNVFGFHYVRKEILANFDFVLGMRMRILFPRKYQAYTSGINTRFWNSLTEDDYFKQELSAESTLYIGTQNTF